MAEADEGIWEPIRTGGRWGVHLRTHLTVLAIVVVSELIGSHTFSAGPGQVVLLPLLYAVVIGIGISYSVLGQYVPPLRNVVSKGVSETSAPLLTIALMPLAVKYGTTVGPEFNSLVSAGPAFLLQELGNLGTIFVALPVALLLGLKRESIGGAVSIAREATFAVVTERYGIESPEGRGVIGVYLTGTVFGTIFFGLLGGLAPITGLHPLALSMACGMGSASMMTACSASLAEATSTVPADRVLAFAATSNLLTGLTGIYVLIFVALPLVNRLYRLAEPVIGRDE